jgi:hypothetical protein
VIDKVAPAVLDEMEFLLPSGSVERPMPDRTAGIFAKNHDLVNKNY